MTDMETPVEEEKPVVEGEDNAEAMPMPEGENN